MKTKNEYKKKIVVYLSIIFLLALVYAATFIFDSQRAALRSSRHAWLEERHHDLISRIEIYSARGTTILERKNNVWVIPETDQNNNIIDYPVRQIRVDDFLANLSRRGNYPIRSVSQAMERTAFGNEPSRVIIRGGAGLPLLDLLIGFADHSGSIFLRGYGDREIRSGEDLFTVFTENDASFWYDLRLFPDVSLNMVQRIQVYEMENTGLFIISRNMNNWIDENTGTVLQGMDSFLRSVIESRGEDFIHSAELEIWSVIILELGDGNIRILDIGPPDIDNTHAARIRGLPLVYSLSEWTVRQLMAFKRYGA